MKKLLLLLLLVGCAAVDEELPQVAVVDELSIAEWIWTDGEMAWETWGEELFALAQREDRPILVYFAAPGYEGLFPAPTSALSQLIAEGFVSVRVDPFKRPDIARHYDSGGWPALVAALPDGRVFARAVDIPPANVEPYLRRLLLAYADKRAVIIDKVQRTSSGQQAQAPFEVNAVYRECVAAYDSTYGGFGGPSKFLEASVLRFLLVYAEVRGVERAQQMALRSLDAILDSPLHAGGGFYAYSHTPDWSTPVREMDGLHQAAMLHLLLESRQPRYIEAARSLLDFIEREFFDVTEGAFRGRQIGFATPWTDPTLYADRQAALIGACLAAAKALEDDRALRLAIRAGDALIEHCIDERGGVWHVCGAGDGAVSGLLVDQALTAWALWELGEASGAARFVVAAERTAHFMEEQLGGSHAFYNRVDSIGTLPRFFSHRDDERPAGNALALEFYGRRGDVEQMAMLVGGLRFVPSRAYGSWARAVLQYRGMAKSSL